MSGSEISKKKILIYAVKFVVGAGIALYWYYFLKGLVSQSGGKFTLLVFITVFYILALLHSKADSPRDHIADEPGGGGETV